MKYDPVSLIHVYYKPGKKIKVGRLAVKDRKILFEYDDDFLSLNLELSPFYLPLKRGVQIAKDYTFEGLFGLFNDSLPDGWSRLLLDRKLTKYQINPQSFTSLDRLCFVGSLGMGALVYEPAVDEDRKLKIKNLDDIASEINEFQENDDDRYVEDLIKLGGSSAGARPKVLLNLNTTGSDSLRGDEWIVKFRSMTDPKDIGCIEYAYHLMAKEAKLVVPEARLFASKFGSGFFGSRRFDKGGGKSIHMHTVSGLLHADHTIPSLDYESILKATMYLTRDIRECEKLFRLCVFNVFSHNRDDHAKNFSFLMNEEGIWSLAPAYDLTFSSGPAGEHSSMVMGEGKNPTKKHLLRLAETCNIKKTDTLNIIDEVSYAISKWTQFSEEVSVSKTSSAMIQKTIEKIRRSFK